MPGARASGDTLCGEHGGPAILVVTHTKKDYVSCIKYLGTRGNMLAQIFPVKWTDNNLSTLCSQSSFQQNSRHANRSNITIGSADGGLLIGQGGTHILALQHLIRLCLRKENKDEEINIYVDVNGYWKEKEKILVCA